MVSHYRDSCQPSRFVCDHNWLVISNFFFFISKKKISFSYPWFTWKKGMRSTQKNPIQLHRFSVSLSTYEVYSVPREWITFLLNLYSPCFYRKFILDRFYQSWNSQVVGKQVCLERVSGNLKVPLLFQWHNNIPHTRSSEKQMPLTRDLRRQNIVICVKFST